MFLQAAAESTSSFHISSTEGWLFLAFGILIAVFLVLDLGVLNRDAKAISSKSALIQSIFMVSFSTAFGILIYYTDGANPALEFFTAYVTEYALSVDNIFVIILILRYFKVEEMYYHKVLFWGILGALVMRAIFIFVGSYFIHKFSWILLIFGAFLLYTGAKMLIAKGDDDEGIDEEKNPVLKFSRRFLRFTNQQEDGKFFVRKGGLLYATPLFLVILMIEFTDLIFAVDSIPAAFGISQNEFVIYTSNIFAVLGLRAMFFLLSNVLDKFYLLQKGLAFVLIFIGVKMLGNNPFMHMHINAGVSLLVIIGVLAASIVLSIIFPKKETN